MSSEERPAIIHFGVRHKEAIKAMRAEVDVLTLTATPIPRTLGMALEGSRVTRCIGPDVVAQGATDSQTCPAWVDATYVKARTVTQQSSLHAALAGEVHVWFASACAPLDGGCLARFDAVLNGEERARASKFVFEEDRRIYLVAHALVRATLSRYLDVPPASWRFYTNEYGRPEILAPVGAPPLRFNLSHARGLVACALSDGADVGVDVETIRDLPELLEIGQRQFSPEEHATLSPLAPAARRDTFFRYWTLKEAYIKARGMGLSLPTKRFTLRFAEDGSIGVELDPSLGDDSPDWQFASCRPTARHAAAVAVRRGGKGDRRIVERWTMPLAPDDGDTA